MSLTPSLAKGAQGAWRDLALCHAPQLFYLCHLLCADGKLARRVGLQAMQNGLIRMKDGKIPQDALDAEVRKQAVVLCRDALKQKDAAAFSPEKSLPASLAGKTDSPLAIAKALSPFRRFLYVLNDHCGYTSKQTGEILRLPANAVESHLNSKDEVLSAMGTSGSFAQLMQKEASSYFLSSEEQSGLFTLVDRLRAPLQQAESQRKQRLIAIVCICVIAVGAIVGLFFAARSSAASTSQAPPQLSGPQNVPANVYQEVTVDVNKTYYADITIRDYGTITVKLDPKNAPVTVSRFTQLAKEGFYDGLTFHRIIEGFMMQGGDPSANGTGGSGVDILGEFTANGVNNTLLHERGVISMARGGYSMNSADSQFFIMHDKAEHLDGKYAAFGIVTQGIEIVDQICEAAQPTDNNGSIPKSQQPVIETITIREE